MALAGAIKAPSLKQMSDSPEVESPAKVFSRGPGSKLKYGLKPPVAAKSVSSRGARLRKQL